MTRARNRDACSQAPELLVLGTNDIDARCLNRNLRDDKLPLNHRSPKPNFPSLTAAREWRCICGGSAPRKLGAIRSLPASV